VVTQVIPVVLGTQAIPVTMVLLVPQVMVAQQVIPAVLETQATPELTVMVARAAMLARQGTPAHKATQATPELTVMAAQGVMEVRQVIPALRGTQALAAAVIGDGLGDSASGLFGWVGQLGGSPSTISVRNVELLHAGDLEHFPDEMRLDRVRTDFLFHWSPAS